MRVAVQFNTAARDYKLIDPTSVGVDSTKHSGTLASSSAWKMARVCPVLVETALDEIPCVRRYYSLT